MDIQQEIEMMADLQGIWDDVLRDRNEIERRDRSIAHWQNTLASKRKEDTLLRESIKQKKNNLKNSELELADLEGKLKKLAERRTNIQTEREMKAVASEIESVQSLKAAAEESILGFMEELDELEVNASTSSAELSEMEKQTAHDIENLTRERQALQAACSGKEDRFTALSSGLSPAVKSRFIKLIQSKEGKAIGTVANEICSVCNFKIPASLAQQAAKKDSLCNCTNCGRFIYVK